MMARPSPRGKRRAGRRRGAALAAILLTAACGGSVTSVDDISPAVADVQVSPASSTVIVGDQLPLQAVVHDAQGATLDDPLVVWSAKDTDVVVVSPEGIVTARAVGATQVAASFNGKSGVAAVTVQRRPVASVTLQPSSATLQRGKTVTLVPTLKDAGGATLADRLVDWKSSDASIATVSPAGLVTAVTIGSATITATSEGKSATAAVSVVPGAVAQVRISPSSASVKSGKSVQLTATALDANGDTVSGASFSWHSSDSDVATVSSSGLVRGYDSGTVTITATWQSKTGSAVIRVTR